MANAPIVTLLLVLVCFPGLPEHQKTYSLPKPKVRFQDQDPDHDQTLRDQDQEQEQDCNFRSPEQSRNQDDSLETILTIGESNKFNIASW